MVRRALFIVNACAAVGHNSVQVETLRKILASELPQGTRLELLTATNHGQVRTASRDFLAQESAPCLIVAGGGGGTLGAVIEGLCEGRDPGQLPGDGRVLVAPLRMGSGNVLARRFGIPRDPETALRQLSAQLRTGRTAPCCVLRCEFDGPERARYAATLGGIGQFGRIPGDIARWHRRLPALHRRAADWLGVERLTQIEYGLGLLIRSVWCGLHPAEVESIGVRAGGRRFRFRLFAGATLNFGFKGMPVDPGMGVEDPAFTVALLPARGRWAPLAALLSPARMRRETVAFRIGESDRIEFSLPAGEATESFLDENPRCFSQSLTIQVAGTLAFVPGLSYPN